MKIKEIKKAKIYCFVTLLLLTIFLVLTFHKKIIGEEKEKEKEKEPIGDNCKYCKLIDEAENNQRVVMNIYTVGIEKKYCVMWLSKDGYVIKLLILKKVTETNGVAFK